MDYDPGPPRSSSYDFNEFQGGGSQPSFDDQFARAEASGGDNSQGMAVASLVIGIVGFVLYVGTFIPIVSWFICGITLIMGIIGIVLAATAMKKISRSGVKSGKGIAIAGLVLNIVQGSLSLIGIIFTIIGLLFLASYGLI